MADDQSQDSTQETTDDSPMADSEDSKDSAAGDVSVDELVAERLKDERAKWDADRQKDIDSAVQKRLARDRRKREAPKAPRTEPRAEAESEPSDDVKQFRQELELRDILDEAGIKLNRRQRSILLREYGEAQPDHPVEWVRETVEELGFSIKSENTQPAQTQTESPKPAQKPRTAPASDQGSPATMSNYKLTGNPFDLTRSDKERMIQENGGGEQGVRKMQRAVREMVERYYRDHNIRFQPYRPNDQ
jgi:hypothetical protein